MSKKISIRLSVLIVLIFLAAFSRVIPHMLNFSPMGAIGLFSAAYLSRKWQVFLLPLAAIWLSDLFINNVVYAEYHPHFTWFYSGFYWQYGAYILITAWGLLSLKKVSTGRVFIAAIGSSAIFFIITNFACWPGNPAYSQNLNGLLTCYAAGVPFLKGTLLGDLCYSAILFGTFAYLKSKYPSFSLSVSQSRAALSK